MAQIVFSTPYIHVMEAREYDKRTSLSTKNPIRARFIKARGGRRLLT
jgi:hypothetical protein